MFVSTWTRPAQVPNPQSTPAMTFSRPTTPAERQIGTVDLQDESRVDDRLILALHDVGQGVEVLLVARVVPVLEKPPDLAGRRRGHEDLVRAGGRGSVLEILDVTLHRRPVLPRYGT